MTTVNGEALTYLAESRERMRADGCDVRDLPLRGGLALVGQRWRLPRWSGFGMRLVTLALPLPWVDASSMESFTEECIGYATGGRHPAVRVLQTSAVAIPVIVTERVTTDADEWVSAADIFRMPCSAVPVVVDLGQRRVIMSPGKRAAGPLHARHLRSAVRTWFPQPGRGDAPT